MHTTPQKQDTRTVVSWRPPPQFGHQHCRFCEGVKARPVHAPPLAHVPSHKCRAQRVHREEWVGDPRIHDASASLCRYVTHVPVGESF